MPLSVTLFYSAISCVIFFIMGGIIGWVGNDVVYSISSPDEPAPYDHPEMYDSRGTPYTGELLTLHFEEEYDEED